MKIVIFLLVALVFSIVFLTQKELVGYIKIGDWTTLKKVIGEDLSSVFLITMGFMLIQNLFSFVPFLLLTMFNIWLFGFVYGYVWSLIGNVLGSLVVFYFARYSFNKWAKKYDHFDFKKKIEDKGFTVILGARILPIIPSSVINIVSGLSNVKQKDFIISTIVGHAFFVLILSTFSLGIITSDQQHLVYIVIFLLLLTFLGFGIRTKLGNIQKREKELLRS